MQVIVGENLIIPSPGELRPRLLSLGLFRRRGRVPKGEHRVVRFYLNTPAQITLPRGLLPYVQAMTPVQIIDRRLCLPSVDFGWHGELRPEQADAAKGLAIAGGGMLVGMPGSGKTNTGLALVAAFRQPTLWLVHTKDLARQATERAKGLFNLPPRAYGYIGEGEFGLGTHFTVGMIQSFGKNPALAQQVGKKFGCIVIDESHHLPAITIARVASQFPARYRVGLTATPDRTDGLGPLARAILGQDLATIDPKLLLARGRILIPVVRVVPTGFRYWGPGQWSALQQARAADAQRNQLVCSIIAREVRGGRRVIVLAELVAHAQFLTALLTKKFGIPAVAVTGDVPPQERKRIFEAVAQGRVVLVATKLADEGLDLPSLDCLVLAAPGRSAPRLQQQVGRVMRSFQGKRSAVVYDLADLAVKTLHNQAIERLQVYRTLGMRVEHGSSN